SAAGTVATTFTPSGPDTSDCSIKFIVTDGCGRIAFDSVTTQVVVPADVSVTKVDTPDPVAAGGKLTYTITVTNGAAPGGSATDVVIRDTLPASTVLVSAAWQGAPLGSTCSISGNTLDCRYADILPKGTSASVRVTAKVLAGVVSPIVYTATVAAGNDQNPANNSATASTAVVHPAIAMDKTATPASGVRADVVVAADDL